MQLEKKDVLENVIKALVSTKRISKAEKYLLNYNFILQKVILVGVYYLINDYKSLLKHHTLDEQKKEALELLLSVFEQVAHIIKDYPKQINSQLFGYLEKGNNSYIDSIITAINEKTKEIWLKPSIPSLTSQQGSLEKVFAGHSENVTAIEVSSSKKWIISGTSKGVITIWDIYSTKNIHTFFDDYEDGVITNLKEINNKYIVSFSSNSKRITLKIWDIKSESLINRVSGQYREKLSQIEVTPKGDFAITKSLTDNKAMVVWKVPTLKVHQTIKFKNVLDVFEVYSHQRKREKSNFINEQKDFRIVTSSYYDTYRDKLKVYRFKWGRFWVIKKFFVNNISNLNSLIIREKTNSVVVSGLGAKIKIFSLSNGKCLHNIKVFENKKTLLTTIFLTEDEESVIVFSDKCSLWNLENEKLVKVLKKDINHTSQSGVIEKGKYAFSDDEDNGFTIWSLKDITEIEKINISYTTPQNFKAVNETQIISNEWHNIILWNLKRSLSQKRLNHLNAVNSIKIFDDGKKAISGSLDKSIKIFDLKNHCCTYTISENDSSVDAIDVFKKEGNYFSISSDMVDGEKLLKIWNLSKNEFISTLKGSHIGDIFKIQVIKKGKLAITSSSDQTVKLWDLNNEKCDFSFYINNHDKKNDWGYFATFQVYNHERNLITATGNGTLRVWDLQYRKLIKELEGHNDAIYSLEISSNGKFALTSSKDGSIKLWDLENFESRIIIEDSTTEFFETFFIPYRYDPNSWETKMINKALTESNLETHIISSSLKNDIIELWEINSKTCIQTFIGHTNKIGFLFVLEKTPRFISLSYTGEIILWNVYTGNIETSLYLGRSISTATITPNEKTLIVGEANGQIHFIIIEKSEYPLKRIV